MEEGSSDAASGGTDSSSKAQCKNCGTLSVQQDCIGSQEYKVCENCGCCEEVTFSGNTEEWCPPATKRYPAGGPTRQGRFHAPKDPKKVRERYFVGVLRKKASKVNLSEQHTAVLEEEGKNLLRNNQLGTTKLTRAAAGLVYLALQRHTRTIRYREVAPQLDMTVKSLGKMVKTLKKQPCISMAAIPVASDEEKMEAAMDKLPSVLPLDTRIKVKKLSMDLKELCCDKKVRGKKFSSLSSAADYAILVIALETIEKKKLTVKWTADFAKNIKLAPGSLSTMMSRVRSILLSLAEELPSIGSKVKSKAIAAHNILQYVPIIVQNKAFLMIRESVEESPESDEVVATPSCSDVSLMAPGPVDSSSLEDDKDGDLSELDDEIKEYIATRKEVAKKQRMQSQS